MDNQYNYYHSEEERKYKEQPPASRGGVPKIVMAVLCAVVFGVVASMVFLTCSTLGGKALELLMPGAAASPQEDAQVSAPVSRASSVVTSDVSDVVEKVMPSIVSITSMLMSRF